MRGETHHFTSEFLLKHPKAYRLQQIGFPSYPDFTLDVVVIPLCHLLNPGSNDKYLTIGARDGYIYPLELNDVFPCQKKNNALIAIEDPQHPWPQLQNEQGTAGPFYLIWPDNSMLEWVYAVTKIEFLSHHPFDNLLKTHPNAAIFLKKCAGCHPLNGEGSSFLAHDLNQPNPLSYFSSNNFRLFIRNPTAIRQGISPKMLAFNTSKLSEKDLDQLIQFFKEINSS